MTEPDRTPRDPEAMAPEAGGVPSASAAPRYDPAVDLAAPEPGGPAFVAAAPPATQMVAPLADVIARPAPDKGGRGTTILLAVGAAIAIGGLAFAGGRLTAPAQATTGGLRPGGQFSGQGSDFGQGPGAGFPGRGGMGGMTISGTVTAVASDSITLKLESGTVVTIPLDGDTEYHASAPATAEAVSVGATVSVAPGATRVDPSGSFDPNASAAPGAGSLTFGAATDVTVVEP